MVSRNDSFFWGVGRKGQLLIEELLSRVLLRIVKSESSRKKSTCVRLNDVLFNWEAAQCCGTHVVRR